MTDKKDLSGMQLDQYRLIRPLDQDQGGFAVVYLAEHVMYKTPVAIKVLNALSTSNIPDFILEAKVVLLEHPNIVRIRDFGVDKGYAYFTMNYLPNGSLRRRHASREPISWETIVIYTKQIAEALQYIHDKGVVHRDVKPENMLIGDNDDIQLSDFGIAITSYTINAEAQKVKGTPLYIAPEQIEGQAVRESDQYSLGAVMYEWLTGVPPFDGIPNEVLQKHLYVQPLALRKRNASVLPQVEAVVMKMLNKRREDRFSSMREFLLELERVKVPSPRMKHTPFTGHADAVQTLTWSPDGKYIASAGSDSTVQIWEPTTHKVLYVYPGHTGEVCSIMWSRDGKAIVSAGADEIVQVWEATTGYSLKSYAPHQGVIRAVAWSPNEMFIASTGDDKVVQVWDLKADQVYYTYSEHGERVLALAWSPDSKYLASGGNDCVVRVWEAMTGAYCCIYRGHSDRVTSVAWSPSGTQIVSTSDDGTVQIWEVNTGRPIRICDDHTQTVSTVAWSPNGQYLASGSWDKTMRIWDVRDGKCLHIYAGHTQWINAVAWSPDSKYIASASWDKSVHIFPFESIRK